MLWRLCHTFSYLAPSELPQQHVCKEEELLSDQERNSSLDQEDPEPPQIKEEQEEICTSQEGEQLVLDQETDSDQKVGVNGDFGSTTDAETKLQVEHHESTSHSNNKCKSATSESLCDSRTGKVSHKCGTCGKIFQHESKLQRHVSEHTREKPLLIVKQKPDTLMLTPTYEESDHNEDDTLHFEDDSSQSGAEKGTVVNISVKSAVLPEPSADRHLLSHNSHESESQVHKGAEHRYSASARNVDTKLQKRLRINLCRIKLNTCKDTKPDKLICEYCGKHCKSKSKLVRHIITHTGERSSFCNTCGKSFRDKYTLRRHTLIHTSAKPFQCKLCWKNFRLKRTFEGHLASHAGKRPF